MFIIFRFLYENFPFNARTGLHNYKVCPESIQPFWISREPVRWPWCNLAASQRRHYCAFV